MAKKSELTLGFIGAGEISTKASTALIEDLIEANGGSAKFVFPFTKEHFTDSIGELVEWAIEEEIDYEAVTDDSTPKKLNDFVEQASKTHKVQRIPHKIVNICDKSGNGRVVILWDDDDEDCVTALERAQDKDVEALDLTNGLDILALEDDGEDEEEEPEEVEDEDEEDDEEEDEEVTAEDIEAMDFKELKELAKEWGVEVPPRTKSAGYKKALLADLEAEDDDEEDEEPEEEAEDTGEVSEALVELRETVEENQTQLVGLHESLLEVLTEIKDGLASLDGSGAAEEAPAKKPSSKGKAKKKRAKK